MYSFKKRILLSVLNIIRNAKHNPRVLRKIKIFAAVGVFSFMIITGLFIWTAAASVNFIMTQANQIMQSPVAIQNLETLKTEVLGLPKVNTVNCWTRAQSLLSVQPWLVQSIVTNLVNLKHSCLDQNQTQKFINITEGKII